MELDNNIIDFDLHQKGSILHFVWLPTKRDVQSYHTSMELDFCTKKAPFCVATYKERYIFYITHIIKYGARYNIII